MSRCHQRGYLVWLISSNPRMTCLLHKLLSSSQFCLCSIMNAGFWAHTLTVYDYQGTSCPILQTFCVSSFSTLLEVETGKHVIGFFIKKILKKPITYFKLFQVRKMLNILHLWSHAQTHILGPHQVLRFSYFLPHFMHSQ